MAQVRQGNRYHEILSILCKHGFGYLAQEIRQGRVLSWCHLTSPKATKLNEAWDLPRRIRQAFEELGPTFIKLGQILSCRPDLIPEEYAQEFSRLQDHVQPMEYEVIREVFRVNVGSAPEEIFAHFQKQPVASASMGQVHLAVLPTGEELAVKIQRPESAEIIKKDMAILKRISKVLQERTVLGTVCDVAQIIDFFERQMCRELDFTTEALNSENFEQIFATYPNIRVPKVYWPYTNSQILTTSFICGSRIEDFPRDLTLEQREQIAENVMYALMLPFFREGVFHGDPHPGNMLLTEDRAVAMIDFGIVGRVEMHFRRQVAQLLLALWSRNARRVMDITLEMGEQTKPINEQSFYEDTAELVEKVAIVGDGGISFGKIIQGVVQISLHYHMKMPSAFLLLGKAILMGEALAKDINPNFNILTVARPLAMQFFRNDMVPDVSPENLYNRLTAWRNAGESLPRDLASIAHQAATGQLKFIFYHRNLQWLYDMLEVISSRIAFSVVIAAMMIGSALVMHSGKGPQLFGYPTLGMIGFMFSTLMGGWVAVILLRNLR